MMEEYEMKQKKIFDKVMKIFAVMVFILSMCFSQKYANNVEAWDNSTPHEFTRIKQIDYPWWWSSKISSAKKWSTYGNTSAGTIPICLWEWENQLKKGDNLILAAFGAGFTWGAVYLKWGYDGKKA